MPDRPLGIPLTCKEHAAAVRPPVPGVPGLHHARQQAAAGRRKLADQLHRDRSDGPLPSQRRESWRKRVGFVHLRGISPSRASSCGAQVPATGDLIVSVSQPSLCQDELAGLPTVARSGITRAKAGGEGGIRTHVPLTGQDAFEAPPLRPLRYLSVRRRAPVQNFLFYLKRRSEWSVCG